MDDWLMWTGIIVILKLFLLAFCYCYRAEQRSKINRRLLREDVEIQKQLDCEKRSMFPLFDLIISPIIGSFD